MKEKKSLDDLRLSKNSVIFGVCQGLANYLEVSVFLVRFLFLISGKFGFTLYMILAICMPEETDNN